MLFRKSAQKQAQGGANPQGAANYGAPGEMGNGAPAQPVSLWAGGSGYPVQPSGTGYAGYTPGAGNQGAGMNYAGGAGAPLQGGYAQGGAYGQAGQGYPQGGTPGGNGMNYAGGAQGYGGQAWSQGGQGYAPQGYSQAPGNAGQVSQGYAAAQGMNQASQGYAVPQGMGQPSQGYAMPQGAGQVSQGYPAQGYSAGQNAQGYAAPQGGYYPQVGGAQGYGAQPGGYNAYAQMGRNQTPAQDYSRQIPINGGGYIPPAVPVKKQPFVFQDWMLIAMGAALLVLLGVALFLAPEITALKWIFLALAVGSTVFFWVRPLVTGSRRLCYTIVFGALSLVALLSAVGALSPRTDATRTPGETASAAARPTAGGAVVDPQTGEALSVVEVTEVPATATPAAEDNSTQERLESFFRFWSANRQDEMLTLCAPSWQSGQDNPKAALFGLMANRTPLDYMVEKVSGTSEDTSRTVTVTSTMDRNNDKDPVKYRLSVLMVKEGGLWFVDPQSLKTYEEAETADPALAATETPSPEPLVSGSTVLYYNPDGGTRYHLDQNCKSTHAKYLPMKGHFTYAEINDSAYAELSPCNVCAAPLRP